jgi:hypothetical protein
MSDQVVIAKDILQSLMLIKRLGKDKIIADLESQEPDLMEYFLEEATSLHHALSDTALSSVRIRQLRRRCESLALVLVLALRAAHLRLWQDDAQGTALEQLNPSQQPPDPQSPSSP